MITETWGVFHSPEEFVAKAVATGHPTWNETMPSRSVEGCHQDQQRTQRRPTCTKENTEDKANGWNGPQN